MENKILVTGGHGLVGHEFIGDKYYKPTSKEFNLKKTDDVNRLMLKGFDSVIHTAGKVGGLGGNMYHKGEFFYDNIMINTNVIESARISGVKNLVAFLSTCVNLTSVTFGSGIKIKSLSSSCFYRCIKLNSINNR